MLICTIGDLLLDVIVRLQEPLARGDDAVAETSAGAGGQAANVAAWASGLGGEGRFVGKRADDESGRLAAASLRGVELLGPVVEGVTGTVVSLVEPGGERTMASDRGVAPDLCADELDPDWFACDWLHVPAYSLAREPLATATEAAVRFARERGARISLDLSSVTVLATVTPMRVVRLEPDLVFATEREWLMHPPDTSVREFVVKYGAKGFTVQRGDESETFPALPADVVDTTGAGDALAAGYLVGGPKLAAEAAARCVAQAGSMP